MERLTRNFAWLAAANIIGSLFTALLFIYLARTLGAEAFGHFSYATSLVLYIYNFMDLGLSTYGIREVAKNHEAVSDYVSNIISFKIAVAFVLFIVLGIINVFCSHSLLMKLLLAESSLMLFVSALATEWAFQGLERMYMVFISFSFTPLIQLLASLVLVRGPQDLMRAPLIIFFGTLPVISIFLKILKFRLRFGIIHMKTLKGYMASSLVIWAISMFTQVYNGLDIVIMGFFRKAEEVGCFTVARRIVGGFSLLLVFLANALLPRLSATFSSDPVEFRRATTRFLRFAVLVVTFVFVPVIIFGREIITLTVGSQYLAAGTSLKLMVMALTLVVFNIPYSTALIASSFEREVLKQAFASACLNIILNFLIVPKYGMIGASISFCAAEGLALIWVLWAYNNKIGFYQKGC
ncbi:MAG: flippase [Candidatus Omnitrophica bacterium]|nr:flippase [Candidatus Omnitrophota bacterium]MCM8790179.1 flippase [Candidatus Omnitrophota bacterium]